MTFFYYADDGKDDPGVTKCTYLAKLIDAGSQFVIKKEGKWLFIKSTVMQSEALPRSVALAERRRATWQL